VVLVLLGVVLAFSQHHLSDLGKHPIVVLVLLRTDFLLLESAARDADLSLSVVIT
jgi:hypothetical protein